MSKRFFIIYDVTLPNEATKEEMQAYARAVAAYLNNSAGKDGAKFELDAAGPLPSEKYEESKTAARVKREVGYPIRPSKKEGPVLVLENPLTSQEDLQDLASTKQHGSHCPNSGPYRKGKKYVLCDCPVYGTPEAQKHHNRILRKRGKK